MVGTPERFMTRSAASRFEAIKKLIGEEGAQHLQSLLNIAERGDADADEENAIAWANDVLGNNDDWTTLVEDDELIEVAF